MPTPLFELDGISKRLGHRRVLRDISFQLDPGESALLLGNNGAGKTTLLRVLSGLMRPSEGRIRFRGRSFAEAGPELRRAVGFLGHESRLYADLTAEENLRLSGDLYGIDRLARRVSESLARVRLDHVSDIPIRAFSSGMSRRVALARLLVCEPEVLLLDEPYTGLDQLSLEVLDGILAEFRARGATLLLTTHQFTPRTADCGRVLVLRDGRLVYNRPEHRPGPDRCAQILAEFGPPSVAE
jgi:heme ABC exporter ATP-binding subunit CcmA